MKMPFLFFTAAIGLLSLALIEAGAEVILDPDRMVLNLRGGGVSLGEVRPRVQLLVGDERKLLDWKPTGEGSMKRGEEDTPLGKADSVVVSWKHPDGYTLKWHIARLRERDGCAIRCELVNRSDQALRLRRFHLLDATPGDLSVEGDPAGWMTSSRYLKYARYYDSLADLQERGQTAKDHTKGAEITREVPYDEDFCLYTDNGKRGMSISAVGDVSFIWTHLHVPEDGKLGLDVTSEMTGVLVEPGESRLSETILVQFAPWRDAGLDMVKWVSSVIKPRGTDPIYGWCSWYCAGGHVTQEHCFDTADFVESRRGRYPFETLQVDEGWSIGRHRWHVNKKFDKGMVPLAEEFKQASPMAGVWLCPATPNSQRIIDGKLVHIGGSGGSAARAFDPCWYVGYANGNPAGGSLDPTAAGAREYMIGELRRLYHQGYRYFKTDFSLTANVESGYHDPKMTHFQAQREMYSVFRRGVGEDSYLLACNGGPTRAVLGLADATRIGTDTNQKWAFCYPPNKFGKPDNVHGSWFPIVQIGGASLYSHLMACDPDVSRVDSIGNALLDPRFVGENKKAPHYQSMATVQTFHGIISLYGGLMMVSDLIYDDHYQQDHRLRMLEIMHPPTPDKGWNFGGGCDLLNTQFGFAAERPWGKWVSMVAWNPDHKDKRDLKIDLAPVGEIGDRFHLWSFWDEEYHGVQDASYVIEDVEHYCSRLLRLTPVEPSGKPTLIGLNFHMSMGSAEVENVAAGADGIAVNLVPSAGAIEGQLVVHSAKPLRLAKVSGCEAFVMKSDEQIYTVVVTERDRGAKQLIRLAVADSEPLTLEQVKADPDKGRKWQLGSMCGLE